MTMKKLFAKFIFIFAFILCFALNVFAAGDLNITSVVYDNSASFLSINTFKWYRWKSTKVS